MIRRCLDILFSIAALAFFGPWMVLLSVLVRLDSPGDPIFRQRRAGHLGRPFVMLKFRTMRSDVDPYGVSPHSDRDPRLTDIGRFLRETSLDELPQLINVLRGEMSLIGPRPLYERQAVLWTPRQRRRLEVKPGLTGYAQVFGRGGLTHEDKIELDLYYVEHRSPTLDLKILGKTVVSVFTRGNDIYEVQYSRTDEVERPGRAEEPIG